MGRPAGLVTVATVVLTDLMPMLSRVTQLLSRAAGRFVVMLLLARVIRGCTGRERTCVDDIASPHEFRGSLLGL